MSKSNYLENRVLDLILGAVAFSAPGTVYVALSTADPTEAGTGLAEPSGNAYARVAVTNNTTNWPAASGGVKSNGTAITFPQATGSWGTITHVALFDAASGGNMLFYAALTTSKAPTTGDTFTIPIGSFTVTEN